MLNHVIMSQTMWGTLSAIHRTAKREVCFGSYCEDPVGGEPAVAKENSSGTEKELIWRE